MDQNEIQTAIEAGQLLGDPKELGSSCIPYALVPNTARLQSLEEFLQRPTSIRQTVTASELSGFVEYVNRFKVAETIIFARVLVGPGSRHDVLFQAVFDYHAMSKDQVTPCPNWARHQAKYSPITTPEWRRWSDLNGHPLEQEAFAAFIEENGLNIVEPTGAQMLELAQSLEATKSVAFKSGVRLDNGAVQLRYEETITAKAGEKGQLEIPTLILLGLRLFQGGPAYRVAARLKYRIKDTKLVMWYEILYPEVVILDACNALVDAIKEKTEIDPILASI
jgi:uncharacterized protein YfdQ (DUF2303 family)